jgi:glutathione S-transferase
MLKVHHLNRSRSTRVLWLLEELSMPYEIVHHTRDAKTRLAPASLGEIHPLSKSPVIEHNDLVICESGAILEYILDQDAQHRLRPSKDDATYYRYLEWLHFAEGSFALPIINSMIMQMDQQESSALLKGYVAKELKLDLAYIDDTLSKHTYFAGNDFTAADIMMATMLDYASSLKLIENRPHISRYVSDIHSRPAYQKAMAFG